METQSASIDTTGNKTAVVFAGDYLNKLTGEKIERECRQRIDEGCTELIVNFSQTEIVNSIGVSILLGVIDSAENAGARVVFSDVNEDTVELFEMLGVSKHAVVNRG
ncbi:MAG: STAS domain-containing protein [Pyrinomonadaceae bacterium]